MAAVPSCGMRMSPWGGRLIRRLWTIGLLPAFIVSMMADLGVAAPLDVVAASPVVTNGVALSAEGRMFLSVPRIDGSAGPQVVEWVAGKTVPFPAGPWNGEGGTVDAATRFVRVNAVRIGPDGALWIVDVGAPRLGGPKLSHGPKIVRVDLKTEAVSRVIDLDAVTSATSAIDDIRFHGPLAYVTDAGWPGIIVVDLATGVARRVLDKDPSVTAQAPLSANDHPLRGPDGQPVRFHADQLEVAPDGKFLYYQPASGPMSRIATRYIDDPTLPSAQLAKHVSTFAKTRATGGTAIDAGGNIYCSDINRHRILKIAPDGALTTLIEDARLLWVDAMWIDAGGYLYMPAAQLDAMAPFNAGVSKVHYPIYVYRMKIDAKPSPIDHR